MYNKYRSYQNYDIKEFNFDMMIRYLPYHSGLRVGLSSLLRLEKTNLKPIGTSMGSVKAHIFRAQLLP